MDSNNIQQIEEGIFSNMSHLDYLTVESNQINRIKPNTFNGLRFLNTLNFQGNLIQRLEQNSFADLGSLSTLLLSNNPLDRIDDGAFRNLGNLTHLFMSYIVEENFQLTGNFLPEMLRLQTLHLVNSPGLAADLMNIINNSATPNVQLVSMTQLDLSYNTLEWVSPRVRDFFPNLLSLPLDGNPLRCSLKLKWLRDWMVTTDVSFHNYDEVVCENPPNLKGRRVRDIENSEWASDEEVHNQAPLATSGEEQSGANSQAAGDTSHQTVSGSATQPSGNQPVREREGNRQGVGKRSRDEKQRRRGKGRKGKKGKKHKKDKKNKDKKSKKGKDSTKEEVPMTEKTL